MARIKFLLDVKNEREDSVYEKRSSDYRKTKEQ